MSKRNADAPRLLYPLASFVGLCTLPVVVALVIFTESYGLRGLFEQSWLEGYVSMSAMAASVAAPHALTGAVFGFVWPRVGWRWGVWLSALPLCVVSFVTNAGLFLLAAAVTLLPACGCAYAAARLKLRQAAAHAAGW